MLHHTPGCANLALRNAPVRFRDAPHDGEGAAEKDRADDARIALARRAFVILGAAIVLMTEQQADQRADRPRSYDRAEQPTDDFSFPLHADFLTVA